MLESEAGRRWLPDVASSTPLEPERVAELVAFLASGRGDALSGRFLHALDDVEALAARADEIVRDDLYVPGCAAIRRSTAAHSGRPPLRPSTRDRQNMTSRRTMRNCSHPVTDRPANDAPYRLIDDVTFGENVVVFPFTNLYGCEIGDDTRIGPFVEIQRGARIGAGCKIQSHAFICSGVEIEDEVFVGHGVIFVNDKFPARQR